MGHKRIISRLNAILVNGNIPHAFLFYGSENIGKLTIAKEFAKSLFCVKNQNKNLEKNCNFCHECSAINDWNHTEVIFLEPGRHLSDEKAAEKEIGINDIRELKKILSLKTQGNIYRPVVINSAENLTEEAQNSLLKILEEPGERNVFILISKNLELLLPTIVSRCLSIGFSLVGASEIRNFIAKKILSESKADDLAKIAYGRPGVALRLLEDSKLYTEEKRKIEEIQKILAGNLIARFNYAEKISKKEGDIKDFFSYLCLILRDIFLENFTREQQLISPKRFISIMKSADYISNAIYSTNVNRRLALEAFLLGLD